MEKYKSVDETDRLKMSKEINSLTEEIDKIQAQKNACIRIISRYDEIKNNFQKEMESKQKTKELLTENKDTNMKNRC